MGTEIAIPVFGPLSLAGLSILVYLAVSGGRKIVTASSMLGLGRSRLALGYLGSLVALAGWCYLQTIDLSHTKVARGDVSQAEAARDFFDWFLTLLCIETPVTMFVITVIVLPLLAVLRRIGFASVIGLVSISQMVAFCCSRIDSSSFASDALLAGALTGGFALAARLSWWRSPAMPVDADPARPNR
jgi:hypothetical protein